MHSFITLRRNNHNKQIDHDLRQIRQEQEKDLQELAKVRQEMEAEIDAMRVKQLTTNSCKPSKNGGDKRP